MQVDDATVKDDAGSNTAIAACFKACSNLASELDAVKKVLSVCFGVNQSMCD